MAERKDSMYITGSFAKKIDLCAIREMGIPSLTLMEAAAGYVFRYTKEAAERKASEEGRRPEDMAVFVACGVGNNGADGLAAGAMLLEAGFHKVRACCCGNLEKATEEFRYQKERFEKAGGRLISMDCYQAEETDIILDALFGIGLRRQVEGPYRDMIENMNLLRNEENCHVIAVDIPSGIDADQGKNMCAPLYPVHADETVTFGWAKTGQYLDYGYGNCGEIHVCAIGYPEGILEKLLEQENTGGEALEDMALILADHREAFLQRDPRANKGDYGKLLIIAGAKGMAGAAYLSGLAAYRTGIGMVKYLGPEENRVILQSLLPEAMYEAYDPESLGFAERIGTQLSDSLSWADLVILGPGLSREPYAESLVREALKGMIRESQRREGRAPLRTIIDADALNILADHWDLMELLTGDMVLTPHIGELARLTGCTVPEVKEHFIGMTEHLSRKLHTNILAKDCVSLLAGESGSCMNTSGSASLAKAGSGDVLTGVIAGCTAILKDIYLGAAAGTFLHGRAGTLAGLAKGPHSTLARDIAEEIGRAMEES